MRLHLILPAATTPTRCPTGRAGADHADLHRPPPARARPGLAGRGHRHAAARPLRRAQAALAWLAGAEPMRDRVLAFAGAGGLTSPPAATVRGATRLPPGA